MSQEVLYTRHVSNSGRVRYTPTRVDVGQMKPGIWLVRDTVSGYAESWIAPICDVPTAIHTACLSTFRDKLALAISKIQSKTWCSMDLAEVCLDLLRNECPPVEVKGKTTYYYVCAGCGRPIVSDATTANHDDMEVPNV
jgi:hypothetical protein